MELLRIHVINQHTMVEPVQACITKIANQYKLPPKEINRLNLAVEEAMVNVIDFGLTNESGQYFDVAIQVNGLEFDVVVCDKGIPGDFIADDYDDKLGVSIMQHVLDQLVIKNLGFNGREQHLIKYLSEVPKFEKREEEEHCELPKDVEFDIHPLRKEEAIEIARCIYDEFGFSYLSETVYYPEQFFDACQRGQIYSLVATAPNGEIAGHLAATKLEHFEGMAEMGIGVVKKKYRKYSIMKKLTNKILEYSEKADDIRALMAEPVLYHPITQKMCDYYGLVPCGMNLKYLTSDLKNTFSNEPNQRLSVGVGVKPFCKSEIHSLYIPNEVKESVLKIYEKLDVEVKLNKSDNKLSEKSWITAQSNHRMKIGKIIIDEIGEDIEKQIKMAIIDLKREKCEVIFMYINLFDKGAPKCYEASKQNGFFFTGCMPMSIKGDYLTMELFIDSVMDYDKLVIAPNFKDLYETVKGLDPDSI